MPTRRTPWLERAMLRSDVAIDFSRHPFDIPAVRAIEEIRFHPSVTFFVGENGSGKSTVLEALAVALGYGPEGGTKGMEFQTTPEAVSELHEALRLARRGTAPWDGFFLRAESFYNVATRLDEAGDLPAWGGGLLHRRSHGEAFIALLMHKLRGDGLYLLDEPEAALSPSRQLAALRAMHELVCGASQFIVATHSPILLAYPNARIVLFDSSGVSEVEYEDVEHVAITRDFLNHREQRLARLLADDEDDEGAAEP
jgi:predicted ATPase